MAMKKDIKFSDGKTIPVVGYGTWLSNNPAELEAGLEEALTVGYRHIDTAYLYQNEDVIGKVLKKWIDAGKLKREDVFLTSKLPVIAMKPEKVPEFVQKCLKMLQTTYIDLYLIHFPIGLVYQNDKDTIPKGKDGKVLLDMKSDLVAIWQAMEKEVEAGRIKSIGLSNCNSKQVERIHKAAKIKPVNLQVELFAYFQQKPLVEFCKKLNITVTSYATLGSGGRKDLWEKNGLKFENPNILQDPVIVKLAEKHKKTPAQILIHHMAQSGIIVIPKSVNPARVKENFDVFNFELAPEDMKAIEGLDKGATGKSFDFSALYPGGDQHPDWPFKEPF